MLLPWRRTIRFLGSHVSLRVQVSSQIRELLRLALPVSVDLRLDYGSYRLSVPADDAALPFCCVSCLEVLGLGFCDLLADILKGPP
jgi:hypothetical protein